MDISTLIGIILLPIMGKLCEIVVNLLKKVDAFSNTKAWVKQAVALVVSFVIAWAATRGYHFVGYSLNTFTAGDVGLILPTIITWAVAQLYHNGKKVAQLPPPPPNV